jgi:ribosome-binding ATPase YchF (GTP1/OBG family)
VEVVEAELILADLASVDKAIEKLTTKARTGEKEARAVMSKVQNEKAFDLATFRFLTVSISIEDSSTNHKNENSICNK